MTKKCNMCKDEKPLTEFGRQAASKDGLKNWCKPCVKVKNRERYERNREKHKEQVREWQRQNKDKVLEYKKNYNRRRKVGDTES